MNMRRYGRLLLVQLRASGLLAMQYRADFIINAALSLVWTATALVPLAVLFRQRQTIAGWSWPEALLVVAWFTVLKGVLDGAIQPALTGVVERIRKGTLDFLLLKPADSQFLVSTAQFEVRKIVDVMAGFGLLVFALRKLRHVPSAPALGMTLVLLVGAVAILYSIWIFVVCIAFYFVRVDNLSYLFASIYDAARWPASVFRGALAVVFTFVIPLAVMTTFPALAILGRLSWLRAGAALGTAVGFLTAARWAWSRAIRQYSSAGG